MKRIIRVYAFCFIAIMGIALSSCQTTPEPTETQKTTNWVVIFQDNFNRADGLLADANWTVSNTNSGSRSALIFNNHLEIKSDTTFVVASVKSVYSYNVSRLTVKVKVPANNSGSFHAMMDAEESLQSNYVLSFLPTNYITIVTNGGNAIQWNYPLELDNQYYFTLQKSNYILTSYIYDTNMNLLNSNTFTDTMQLNNSGKVILMGNGLFEIDDFVYEAFIEQ